MRDSRRHTRSEGRGGAVRLESLWKTYREVVAVRDTNLAIAPGEFITLLGPSGSGKTTTLMMIAGFVTPSHGEIYIDDRPVAKIPAQKRDLGMVFQNYALFPHMTVAENIAFPLQMRRVPKHEIGQRVERALEVVQLPGYGERYPRQLSGGQQQRVALARAVVFEPRVLLMDEPLGALDKKLREHMQLELKHIQQRLDVTVIYVTHDQEEALTMSDRIAVMRDGRIEQVGNPTELYEDPVNTFVADFIGESNFLGGVVAAVGDDGLVTIDGPGRHAFRATAQRPVSVGADVLSSVRPERLAIVPCADATPDENRWRGSVDETIYVGDAIKYKVTVDDVTLTIKDQNRDAAYRPSAGDVVDIVWNPIHTKLLQDAHLPNIEESSGGLHEVGDAGRQTVRVR